MANECKYVKDICAVTLHDTKLNVETANIIKNLCACALNCCDGCKWENRFFFRTLYAGLQFHCFYSFFVLDETECILKCYNLAELYSKSLAKHYTSPIDASSEEMHKSQWKLYTIYKDLAISLDPSLFTVIKDVLSIVMIYADFKTICE